MDSSVFLLDGQDKVLQILLLQIWRFILLSYGKLKLFIDNLSIITLDYTD